MNDVWSYILDNAKWIFSGIGVAVVSFIAYFLKRRSTKQYQKGGRNSTNVQVGRDININKHDNSQEP